MHIDGGLWYQRNLVRRRSGSPVIGITARNTYHQNELTGGSPDHTHMKSTIESYARQATNVRKSTGDIALSTTASGTLATS